MCTNCLIKCVVGCKTRNSLYTKKPLRLLIVFVDAVKTSGKDDIESFFSNNSSMKNIYYKWDYRQSGNGASGISSRFKKCD